MPNEIETPPAGPRRPLKATNEAFEENELSVRTENCRQAIQVGILFIPLGSITDYWLFPEYFVLFGAVRVMTVIILGALLIQLRKPGPGPVILLSHFAASLPTIMILWMISYLGDPLCSYREGLSLVLVVAAMILRWRFIDSVISGLFSLTAYSLIFYTIGGSVGDYLSAFYFLFASATFSALFCFLNTDLRHREFYLKEEVEANRLALLENNDELQSLAESKSRFFANVSHELRTPLTLILGPIEQLCAIPDIATIPRARIHIETLSENGFRLLRLINDLLEVARIETGDLPERLENIDLNQFSQRILRSLSSTAQTKEIDFSISSQITGNPLRAIDQDRLEKIITNLLINALKFTSEQGRVSLTINDSDNQLTFTVSDTGIGLTEEELPHIFERFWQANASTARKSRGAGIGLALAKNLAESMGGQLTATSKAGVGTTFKLTLPPCHARDNLPSYNPILNHPTREDDYDAFDKVELRAFRQDILNKDKPPSAPFPEGDSSPKQFLILIIDDEENMRSHLSSCLDQHRTISCECGQEGLKLARQHLPDLIILDYMMPGLDGIEVATRLRSAPRTNRIPIILITAHGGDAPRIRALEAGVNDFLTKPFFTSELNVRVHNLLLQKKYQSDLQLSNDHLSETLVQLKEKEEELIRSEKLSSLGQMSAGIVHEINNPLNYANTSLHILKSFRSHLPASEQDDYDETLDDLADALQRVIRIITDLRSLTRGSEVLKFPIKLQHVVTNSLRLLSHELQNISLSHNVPPELEIIGNDNQLCQVLVNLIQNALHATCETPHPQITLEVIEQADGFVRIILSDNGHGIPNDILGKIFDPFFTTKDIGAGTGLGLSLTLKIIQDHNGSLRVQSKQGSGTTFHILLPTPSFNTEASS